MTGTPLGIASAATYGVITARISRLVNGSLSVHGRPEGKIHAHGDAQQGFHSLGLPDGRIPFSRCLIVGLIAVESFLVTFSSLLHEPNVHIHGVLELRVGAR